MRKVVFLSLIVLIYQIINCHEANVNCRGSYIHSIDGMKHKKTAISHVNDNDKCFQSAATVALSHKEIRRNS